MLAALLGLAPPAFAGGEPDASNMAAAQSPWVAATASGFKLGTGASVPLALGAEFGGYLARRVRLAGRAAVPALVRGDVCRRQDVIFYDSTGVFTCLPARRPAASFGLSAGVVVLETQRWVLAPGVTALHTNVTDHGVLLGGSLPLDWVSSQGWRVGLELGLGAAVGQKRHGSCRNHVVAPCTIGSVRRLPNQTVLSGFLALSVGWSLGG